MKVSRFDAEKSLRKKGFHRDASGDHIYFHHMYDGKATGAYTKVSHSAKLKDISGDLLTSVRKQLKLDSNREAVALLKCPMDGDRYNSILVSKGVFVQEDR